MAIKDGRSLQKNILRKIFKTPFFKSPSARQAGTCLGGSSGSVD